jgi:hypothetical protein
LRQRNPTFFSLLASKYSDTGTAYLHALPDTDTFYAADAITDSPKVKYPVNFTTPRTYTIWARGYADNADADAVLLPDEILMF